MLLAHLPQEFVDAHGDAQDSACWDMARWCWVFPAVAGHDSFECDPLRVHEFDHLAHVALGVALDRHGGDSRAQFLIRQDILFSSDVQGATVVRDYLFHVLLQGSFNRGLEAGAEPSGFLPTVEMQEHVERPKVFPGHRFHFISFHFHYSC